MSRAQDQDDIKLYGKKAKELARQSHWGFVLSLLTDLATRDLKLKLGVPNGSFGVGCWMSLTRAERFAK